MIPINELYLINIADKSPYALNPDVLFAKLIPSINENQTIDELTIREYTYYFKDCARLVFQYNSILDKENKLPFQSNKNLYTYTISGTIGEIDNFFTNDERLNYSNLESDTYQIIFKDYSGNWFICYAEFISENILIESDRIIAINLTAEEKKEELYRILDFEILSDARQEYNIGHDGDYILASDGGKTINVD